MLPAVPGRGQSARRGCVLIAEAGFSMRRNVRAGLQGCGYWGTWVGGAWRCGVCVGHGSSEPHNSHAQPTGENCSRGQFFQFGTSGAVEVMGDGHDASFCVRSPRRAALQIGRPPRQSDIFSTLSGDAPKSRLRLFEAPDGVSLFVEFESSGRKYGQ